jgi:hypothetical protein
MSQKRNDKNNYKERPVGMNGSPLIPFIRTPLSVLMALALGLPLSARALEEISDNSLSDINGQSGLVISINGQLSANNTIGLLINPDAGVAGTSATVEFDGSGSAATPNTGAIGNQGVTTGGGPVAFTSVVTLDAGSTSLGTAPALGVNVQSAWNRMRIQESNQLIYAGDAKSTHPAFGFGAMALDTVGSFNFSQSGQGLFSLSPTAGGVNNTLHLTLGGPQFTPSAVVAPNNPYAQYYYRQGAAGTGAELLFDKMYFDAGFTPGTGGTVGICGTTSCNPLGFGGFAAGRSGLYIGTSHLDFNMTWDVAMRTQPLGGAAGGFRSDQGDVLGMTYWGWTGGFNKAELLVSGGGLWAAPTGTQRYNPSYPTDSSGSYTSLARTGGLNLGFQADFDSNFTWIVGEATGHRIVGFSNWVPLDATVKGISAPNITMDVISGTAASGVGGLCWGGNAYGGSTLCTNAIGVNGPSSAWGNGALAASNTATPTSPTNPGNFLNFAPAAAGLALVVRNMNLQAYSTKVTLYDDANNDGVFTAAETKNYNWGLIYTLGQVDGNVYYYPGNIAGAPTANGISADMLFMSQSFYPTGSNGNVLLGNTNLMISDTTKNLAIGLTQANILFAAKQLNLSLIAGATAVGGIQLTSNDFRLEIEGIIGGGPVPTLAVAKYQKVMYLDANLQASLFNALLYPDSSNGYPFLGYKMRLKLGVPAGSTTAVASTLGNAQGSAAPGGSFLTMAEPSNPNASVTFSNITGDMNITGGRLFLISSGDAVNAPDGLPRLQIAQTMQLGTTVAGGTALTADVNFGNQRLGGISIPSGQIYSSVMLKPQM